MLELLVCDIAGTTVQEHGAVYAALQDAVAAAGADVDRAAVARWMGADKHQAVRALLAEHATDELADEVHADFRVRLHKAYEQRPPEPFQGVPELLGALRARGIRVALTTGFDRTITDPLLASIGWDEATVDAVICSDDVPAGRPAPYMVFRAMERCAIHRVDRVAVVGDTVLDLRAGANAGAAGVIGVLTGGVDSAVLGVERHTHLLSALADLPSILEAL